MAFSLLPISLMVGVVALLALIALLVVLTRHKE